MRVFSRGPNTLFEYRPGMNYGELGGLFTRATTATYIDRDGRIRTAASGELRDNHWVNGKRTVLIETSRTQILSNPQAPASWGAFGASPAITTGITDPFGGATAILVDDGDVVNREGKQQTVTYTGDATKAATFVVRPGTASDIALGIQDGATDRHQINVRWNGNDAPTLSTIGGAGLFFTPVRVFDADGNIWWMISLTANGVLAAGANFLYVVCNSASGTGSFYFAGANTWNATFPTSWQPSLNHVRATDHLRFTHTAPPQESTLYVKGVELGSYLTGASTRIVEISAASADPRLVFYIASNSYRFLHDPAAASESAVTMAALGSTFGSNLEFRGTLLSTGATRLFGSLDGRTEVIGGAPAAQPLSGAWSGQLLTLGSITATGAGAWAFEVVRLLTGTQTMAACRLDYYSAIVSENSEMVHLIEFDFSGGPVRLSTGAQDLTWNSIDWQAVGGLLEFSGIEETNGAKGQGVDMKLSGVDQALMSILLSSEYRGRIARIYRAHLNRFTGQVVGDALLLFEGLQLSPYQIEEARDSRAGGTVTITTRLSGYFGIEQTKGIQANVISHGHIFSGETFFQHVPSLADSKVYWGDSAPRIATRRKAEK